MARKILVINARGEATPERLKKSIAILLVRRLLADWIEENVSIRRRAIRSFNPAAIPQAPKHYIPDFLPAVEANTKFRLPNSPDWREVHLAASNRLRTLSWMTLKAFKCSQPML